MVILLIDRLPLSFFEPVVLISGLRFKVLDEWVIFDRIRLAVVHNAFRIHNTFRIVYNAFRVNYTFRIVYYRVVLYLKYIGQHHDWPIPLYG